MRYSQANVSRWRNAWLCLLTPAVLWSAAPASAQDTSSDDLARLIVSHLKQRKGLALDLGCGDAGMALAVARHSDLTIQCVAPDPGAEANARKLIDAAGLYGTRVTVASGDLARLDYPSYSANLVLCGDEFIAGKGGRDFRELYRVLSPNGIAWIGQSSTAAKKGVALKRPQLEEWLRDAGIKTYTIVEEKGLWARITRPHSPGWDEWTHRSHDPANTFGSEDTLVGPHFKSHWVSDYRPGLSSAAVAAAGGRIVLASLSYDKFPETTPHIQVLDAFTGMELWAKVGKKQLPIERPPTLYSNRESCSDIAVVGDNLYLLGGKFCHVFDLASGQLKQSIAIPKEAKPNPDDAWLYLACAGDLLYGGIGKAPGVKTDWNTMMYRGVSRVVFALERTSGKLRWLSDTPARTCSLSLGGGQLYFCDAAMKLRALDVNTGKPMWTNQLKYQPGSEIAGCSYYRDKVWLLYNQPHGKKDRLGKDYDSATLLTAGHNSRELDAYSAKDGKHLFYCPFGTRVAGVSFAGGRVFGTGQHGGEGISVVDVDTGAFQWKARENLKCTPSLATPHCFFSQRAACASVLDLTALKKGEAPPKDARLSFTGFRPSCSYPGLPANGMIYQQAEGCACASPIRGNMAFIPGKPSTVETADPVVKGSAFGAKVVEDERPVWATARADHLRSAQTSEPAPAALAPLWTAKLSGQLTGMAAGQGLVFCGGSDHKVYALDAATGKPRWQHIGAGRIQAAPFLWRGRLLCTDDEGWAYALRADQGDVIWKFRAALGQERIVGYGGFMSRWPARTGVLVHDDIAYFAAGFFPDEGTAVYAVDPRTGQELWQKAFNSGGKGGRIAGFVPDGAMALANNRLYIPSGAGMPWQVELDSSDHPASFTPGTHVRGHQIMVAGNDLLAVTPNLQYVHHVHYSGSDVQLQLPLVTKDTIYLLNQPGSGTKRHLVAARKDAYQLGQNRVALYVPKKDIGKSVRTTWRWTAWNDEPMYAIIATGDTIFTGGDNKIYATRAADGKELWSAAVPGRVEDLAFHDGRLFVKCASGAVLCFGQK